MAGTKLIIKSDGKSVIRIFCSKDSRLITEGTEGKPSVWTDQGDGLEDGLVDVDEGGSEDSYSATGGHGRMPQDNVEDSFFYVIILLYSL